MTRTAIRETILWLGAALGVVSIVLAAAAMLLDVKPLVFRSGSMSPAIDAGALALAREVPATEVGVGDVVSVVGSDGVRVTHRVVSTGTRGETASLTLKGDANTTPDPEAYNVATVDRVIWDVPQAGRVVAVVGSPLGVFGSGLLVAACLYLVLRPAGEPRGPRAGTPGRRRKVDARHVAVILGVVSLALPAAQPQRTLAYFTDTGSMTSGVIAAAPRPVAPATMTCTDNGVSSTLTFSNAAATSPSGRRYTHVIELSSSVNGTNPTTTTQIPVTTANKTHTVNSGLLGGLFSGSNVYVRVYSAFVDSNNTVTWRSTDYRSWRLNVSLVLGRVTCGASVA